MSGMFSKPKRPKMPNVEKVATVVMEDEDEKEVKRRERRKLTESGRAKNILYGLQSVLKQRLGE